MDYKRCQEVLRKKLQERKTKCTTGIKNYLKKTKVSYKVQIYKYTIGGTPLLMTSFRSQDKECPERGLKKIYSEVRNIVDRKIGLFKNRLCCILVLGGLCIA